MSHTRVGAEWIDTETFQAASKEGDAIRLKDSSRDALITFGEKAMGDRWVA
jgi:hypothetical protein